MRRIAILNQKGGVGKTTTTVNLSAALAATGRRVCVLDLDPQAHATTHLGLETDGTLPSIYDVLVTNKPLASVRREADTNLWLCPADINLAAAEVELAGVVGREVILREALAADAQAANIQSRRPTTPTSPRWGGVADLSEARSAGVGIGTTQNPTPASSASLPMRPPPGGEGWGSSDVSPACDHSQFDYMLMDCGPSLGVLTLNALAAADEVFIPLQPHFLALHGLSKLLETTALVSRRINPKLKVTGVVVCLFDGQTKLAQEVVNDLRAFLDKSRGQPVPWADARVFDTKIRRNVKLAECPSHGKSIFRYAATCPGATDYASLANEVVGAVDVGGPPSERSVPKANLDTVAV